MSFLVVGAGRMPCRCAATTLVKFLLSVKSNWAQCSAFPFSLIVSLSAWLSGLWVWLYGDRQVVQGLTFFLLALHFSCSIVPHQHTITTG